VSQGTITHVISGASAPFANTVSCTATERASPILAEQPEEFILEAGSKRYRHQPAPTGVDSSSTEGALPDTTRSEAAVAMSAGPTVFVVDDNLGVRKSLQALFASAGLGVETYASSEEFLNTYDPLRMGCLVLDIRLPNQNGLDLQDELRRRNAMLPIIILTGHGSVASSVRALKAGATDFLQKPVPPKVLLERVRAAVECDRQARQAAADLAAVAGRLAHLTPRERDVVEQLITGKTSKEIATALGLSARTVEGHRRVIFLKMGVSSATQLVRAVMHAQGMTPRS
jgi:two-component system, LuxR family, response regulator FixJ